jgi:hypothetical protein
MSRLHTIAAWAEIEADRGVEKGVAA